MRQGTSGGKRLISSLRQLSLLLILFALRLLAIVLSSFLPQSSCVMPGSLLAKYFTNYHYVLVFCFCYKVEACQKH